jgi:hypothetical protein
LFIKITGYLPKRAYLWLRSIEKKKTGVNGKRRAVKQETFIVKCDITK